MCITLAIPMPTAKQAEYLIKYLQSVAYPKTHIANNSTNKFKVKSLFIYSLLFFDA